MSTIRILTDSTADLPQELINKYNIIIAPLRVHFGEESFLEKVEISSTEFYSKLQSFNHLPTTSQPSPGEFIKIFEDLSKEGVEEVIAIHLSTKMSGTYQSAQIAKNMVKDKINIEVIDSRLVSMGLGLLVLAAAKAAAKGYKQEKILETIKNTRGKIKTFFVVDTLENLQKGGRIGKATYLMGNLLNIKPILTVFGGEIHNYEKVRGKGKAIDRLVDIISKNVPEQGKINCAIVHSNDNDTALNLREKIASKINCSQIIISEIGAVVGTHAGPGTVAVMFYPLED